MPLLSEAESLSIIEPYQNNFRNLVLGAWDDYLNYSPEHRRVHDATCRANIVNNHMRHRARSVFHNPPDATVMVVQRMFLVVIDQRVAIRLKMFSPNKTSNNIKTSQNDSFLSQSELPGLEAICHLECGYILDPMATSIMEIWLTCPSGSNNHLWSVCMYRVGDDQQTNLTDVKRISTRTETQLSPKRRDEHNDDKEDSGDPQ